MMPRGIASLRLTIDVTYRLNGTRASELEKPLSNVAITAASNGWFKVGTNAEVKTWGWNVTKIEKGGTSAKAQQSRPKKPAAK